MDSTSKPHPPEAVGPYRLEDLLGRGGMGEVYRAYDTRLGRRVAIKHIRPEAALQRTTHARFRREASTVAKLSHPAIVQIFDVLDTEDGDWIVMEYIDGPTLTSIVARGPLDLDRALTYGRQVAEGLAEAHEKGVLHRDLKTENVMVTPSGHAKILDFGLAKQLDAESGEQTLTRGGEIMGTGRAMSPEQARGLELGPRSDLFSLGVLLYELLTGRPPFRGETTLDTLTQLVSSHQTPVAELSPGVPRELSDLVDRLLEKAPELRPQSARQVAAKLEEIRMRHVSGASAVLEGTDYAGATTFVSDAPLAGPNDEPPHSDSIFRTATGRRAAVFAALALLLVIALGWTVATQTESHSTAPPQPSNRQAELSVSELIAHGFELLNHYDRGDSIDRAISSFTAATTRESDSALAYAGLGRALWRKFDFENAEKVWLDRAASAAERGVQLDAFLTETLLSRALVRLSQRDEEGALADLESAAAIDPDNSSVHVAMGLVDERSGRSDEARDHYATAVDIRPDDHIAWNYLGSIHFRTGGLEEAARCFERVIELDPETVIARRNLSVAYFLSGRASEAKALLQAALKIDPQPSLYANLGTILYAQGLYAEAVGAYEKALNTDAAANNYQMWGNLADAYRWAERPEKARAAYLRALQLMADTAPDDVISASRRWLYLSKVGRCEEGLVEAPAEQFEGVDGFTYLRLSTALEICGRRSQAIRFLDRALDSGLPEAEIESNPELDELRQDLAYHEMKLERGLRSENPAETRAQP